MFILSVIGIPVLIVFAWIDDHTTRTVAAQNDDTIAGRCETCGDLTRSKHAHYVYEPHLERRVLVCPSGNRMLTQDPSYTRTDNRAKALQAIRVPMIIKRLR